MFYFIVNIHGGSGKALKTWKKIKSILIEQNVEFKAFYSLKKGHAIEIAKNISDINDEVKKVVVVGGDGTLNEVLNGFTDFSKIQLGIISTGSANDFVKGLKLGRKYNKTEEMLNLILNSRGTKKIDLGQVVIEDGSKRIFGISSGIGLDAIICKETNISKTKVFLNKIKLGKFSYIVTTLKSLLTMKYFSIKLKIDQLREIELKKVIFMAGMNMFGEGGGVKMAPAAVCDDGKISMICAYGFPQPVSFIIFPFLVFGTHTKMKGFTLKDFKTLEITTDEPQVLHADGEYLGEFKHVRMECLPSVLSMLI